VPTWIAAIGTVGAFIAAFIQIATERRLRHDREVKEQARLVAAITGPVVLAARPGREPEDHRDQPAWFGPVPATEDRTGIDLINGSSDRLPDKFTRPIYAQKCDAVYQHVFDSYWDDGHSVYDRAA
jgi:hypothetical protein